MAETNVANSPVTRAELREEFDRLRGELFRNCATKADFADLRAWLVAVLLIVVLNVVGAAGAIVAALLAG